MRGTNPFMVVVSRSLWAGRSHSVGCTSVVSSLGMFDLLRVHAREEEK